MVASSRVRIEKVENGIQVAEEFNREDHEIFSVNELS